MKNLGAYKDIEIPLHSGVLDGRYAVGTAEADDFAVLVNVATWDARGRARLCGWTRRATASPSNEDLHDQLLGAVGQTVNGEFVPASPAPQREAVTLLGEVRSSAGVRYAIAGTHSRLYASTGQGRNFRLLAEGLGGEAPKGPWPGVRLQMAVVGDVCLFTNNVDPVLAWPIGGPVLTTGSNAGRAAFPVWDLQGLNVDRAGVVASWGGFAFLGDVTVYGQAYGSRVYWSDYNRPQEWAPGGESVAGYVDLGHGERVLALAPLGGALRCYTDQAIYSVDLVGGDAVFLFREIYRGDLSLFYKHSLINTGDTHLWLTQDSLVTLGQYDKVPQRPEWLHRAAGFIFEGLNGEVLADCAAGVGGFNRLDTRRCHQIAAGWDARLENAWISWPTQRTSTEAPDDPADFEGVRRMTLLLNPRYNRASLVDAGVSACAELRRDNWASVRDFLITYGVCDPEVALSAERMLAQKEGQVLHAPANTALPRPVCLWNAQEDPTQPMSTDSLAYLCRDVYLSQDCERCVSDAYFCLATTSDFCLKEFRPEVFVRETYVAAQATTYVPANASTFPNVLAGVYAPSGYPTLWQGVPYPFGTQTEKLLTRVNVQQVAAAQDAPGNLCAQVGVGPWPGHLAWSEVRSACLGPEAHAQRPVRALSYPFYRAGAWLAWRLYVTDAQGQTQCRETPVTLEQVTLAARAKAETWRNT